MTIRRTETRVTVTGFPWCAKVITPDDDADLTNHQGEPQAMTVLAKTEGDVKVIPMAGEPEAGIVFTVAAGDYVPVLCKRVLASGTTATELIGLF